MTPRSTDDLTDTVVVTGVGRSGVSTLVDALRVAAPGLRVVECTPHQIGLDHVGPGRPRVGLLVIDPSSVVGAEERGLLDRVRGLADTVAVVCTKVDAFWDWPTNARASRTVLDPDERLPVFAVSGAAALAGALDESGVDDLVAWVLTAPPAGTARPEESTSRPAPAAHVDELLATRARLMRLRDRGRADRLAALRSGLGSVRSRAIADLNAGVRDITAASKDAVTGLRRADVDAHVAWVGEAMTRVRDRVEANTRADLDHVRAIALLGIEPVAPATRVTRKGPVELRARTERRRSAEDVLVVLLGASAGLGVGRLVVTPLAQVHTLQWVSMPLALVVGVAIAVWVVRLRRIAALRTQVRAWTVDAVAESRAGIEHDLLGRVTAAEPVIAGQIMRHHERRTRLIADDVAAIDADLRALGRPRRRHGRDPGTPEAARGTGTDAPTSETGRGLTTGVRDGADTR